MKKKVLLLPMLMAFMALVLAGCEPLMIFDTAGPNAKTLSDTIILSILTMAIIVVVVFVLLIVMLVKYRASKQPADYEPPHVEGSLKLEIIWTVIPIIIVTFLSIVTIYTTDKVENKPEGYGDKESLVIYASSSEWKWHFSYPEQGIETVNYANIPTDRPIEIRLYSFGTLTSFWVPQLAGQKYAMSDMLTTLHLAADEEGEYWGRNTSFNGEGYAAQEFEMTAMKQADFDEWVADVKAAEPALTEEKFNELLEADHVGRETFASTHLEFSPAPLKHSEMMDPEQYKESDSNSNKNLDTHKHQMGTSGNEEE